LTPQGVSPLCPDETRGSEDRLKAPENDATAQEAEFLQEAGRELAELMREVSESARRHGPQPRTVEQDRTLLLAKLDALRLDHEELLEDLDALTEPQDAPDDPVPIEAGRWMRGAKRELAQIIRDVEGPNPPQSEKGSGGSAGRVGVAAGVLNRLVREGNLESCCVRLGPR
jgi:hypothetical protein